MKINSIKNIKLRNYKNYKIIYKYNLIKNYIHEKKFILFFYTNILNSNENASIKKLMKENNLNFNIITKNSLLKYLSNNNLKYLNNIMNNNIMVVYNENNEIIDSKIIKLLLNENKLTLVGGLWNKKFYRAFEIKKLSSLKSNFKTKPIGTILNQINILKFNLSFLKSVK